MMQRSSNRQTHSHTVGRKQSKTYMAWVSMKERCYNPKKPKYHRYGGRGIKVCARWMGNEGFSNFLSDMGVAPVGTSLDRKDNDGDYEPGNCRWADSKTQGRNTSTNKMVTFNGKTQCLSAWSDETGIGVDLISQRLINGWDVGKALTKPSTRKKTR